MADLKRIVGQVLGLTALAWLLAGLAHARFFDHYAQYSSDLQGEDLATANHWYDLEKSVATQVGIDGTVIALICGAVMALNAHQKSRRARQSQPESDPA